MSKTKLLWCAWLGLTLTSLFLYPLFSSLREEAWYFQWRRTDTMELWLTIVVMTGVGTLVLYGLMSIRRDFMRGIGLCVVGIVPVTSYGIEVARQAGLTDTLIAFGARARYDALFISMGLVLGILLVLLARRYSRSMVQVLIGALVLLSPVNLIALWTMMKIAPADATISIAQTGYSETSAVVDSGESKNIIILLFDEMSYDYLYDRGGTIRSLYPNLARLSSMSDNYHRATAPSSETFKSIPQMLLGVRDRKMVVRKAHLVERFQDGSEAIFAPDTEENLFSRAGAQGFVTAVVGPYLAYCEMFRRDLDYCRSYSVYNYSNVHESISFLDPIRTNSILWPRQPPLGWAKRFVYPRWQRLGIAQSQRSVLETFRVERPLFLFAHLYIPHLPFTFDRTGFHPADDPFLQNEENYVKQLEYVDVLVGDVIRELEAWGKFDQSVIIILADHNYRIMVSDDQKSHVPMMIKGVGQQARRDMDEETRVEEVLWNLFERME